MLKNANVIGQNVVKFRHQAGWTQEMLVARMQLLGGYMTRDIIAQIETRRSAVSDERVMFFCQGFRRGNWASLSRKLWKQIAL
jgi:hypothetical protein